MRKLVQGAPRPVVMLANVMLAQRDPGAFLKGGRGKHKQVARLDHGIAVGDNGLGAMPQYQDDEHACRLANLRQAASGKGVPGVYLELDKRKAVSYTHLEMIRLYQTIFASSLSL